MYLLWCLKLSYVDLGNFKIDISSSGQRIPVLAWKACMVESGDLFVLHQNESWWQLSLTCCLFVSFSRSASTDLSIYEKVILGTSHIITLFCWLWVEYRSVHSIYNTLHSLSFKYLKRKDDDACKISFTHHLLLSFFIVKL